MHVARKHSTSKGRGLPTEGAVFLPRPHHIASICDPVECPDVLIGATDIYGSCMCEEAVSHGRSDLCVMVISGKARCAPEGQNSGSPLK